MKQLNYQKNSGLVNQATSVKAGGHIGAEYMLNGNLSSIVKNVGGKSDVYYKFTLKLQNVQTGIVEWTSEKEIRILIRKPAGKSLFYMDHRRSVPTLLVTLEKNEEVEICLPQMDGWDTCFIFAR